MSEQDENEARIKVCADLMMRQLLELREMITEIEQKLYPYHRIISDIVDVYKEARGKLGESE